MRSLRSALRLLVPLCLAAVPLAQGSFTTEGRGCPEPTTDTGPVLYGTMPAGGWHLGGANLTFAAAGGSWSVGDGGEFIEPTAAATYLDLGDDVLISPVNLSFPFTYPGGAGVTTAIDVNSNGRIYFEAGTNTWGGGWNAGQILPDFLAATPSVCVLGADMNTGDGGLLSFEEHTFGADTVAVITWEDVPEYPSQGANTFQCQLWSTGDIVCAYGELNGTNAAVDALVGVSAGGGAADPGASDLFVPLVLSLEAGVPVIGNSATIAVHRVPPAATLALLAVADLGTDPLLTPLWIGRDRDCRLLIPMRNKRHLMNLDPPDARVTFDWPYSPALVGLEFQCQAFVGDPSIGWLLLSDRGVLELGAPPDLALVVEGSNTFDGSPQHLGFFRLESSLGASHADVVRLEVAFLGPDHYFDTVGNLGMDGQGFFSDGNGLGPACMNAYYGSDVATGLVYGGPGQDVGCEGNGYTGWVGHDSVGGSLTRFRRVVFEFTHFAAGEVFRFDCDTDGGDWHAGALPLEVTVELADGTVITQPVQMVNDERAEGVLIQ